LIESKAQKAIENFKRAGVNDLIELRIGDAMETLNDHTESIDLLLLDGWKDLYLPIFLMLEPNFHAQTIIYVDNAEMTDTKGFLKIINKTPRYEVQYKFGGKVALIKISKI
jgi:predicted O-methyltransferase YrrM